uniref:TGF-beta family profile domain-containing protein n=1 Tax=Loxodonta africana TaxID=9785 RepID=G3U5S8_LOXAF
LFMMEELGHAQGLPQCPPGFMLDFFQRVADPNGITKDPDILIGNMEKAHRNHSHFFFNVSSVGKQEKVLRAELHVFKLQHPRRPEEKAVFSRSYYMHYFFSLGVLARSFLTLGFPKAEELVNSSLYFSPPPFWTLALRCSQVASWIQGRDLARSFLVLTTKNVGELLTYGYDGIDRRRNGKDNRNSLLVIYTKNQDKDPPTLQGLLPLPTVGSPGSWTNREGIRHRVHGDRTLCCQRYPPYVDFQTTGWSNWVTSPPSCQVNYCKGQCLCPLGHRSNASNYASFLSFLCHVRVNPNISRPSCVPNQLTSINLLYFNEQEVVVLRQYTDMTVDSCGCH